MAWGSGLRGNGATPVQSKSAALDINSPRLLEAIRGGVHGVQGESAMRVSAVYSCVKVLAESLSAMPIHSYAITQGAGLERNDPRTDRLVAIAPSESQTAAEMWSYVVTCMALHGNAYLYMTRTSSGKVVELLPIPPSSVDIKINGNRISYSVTLGEDDNKRTVIMTPRELLHFKGLTLDGYTGISPITYNTALISGEKSNIDFANRIIAEGATPRGVLETDGVLSDDAFENLRDSWNGAHGGSNNGNRVALLESGVTYKPVSMSPSDLQLLEARKFSRNEIAGIYRVPPHMIGEMSNATYSNIVDQSRSFYQYTLAPWINVIEQRLNHTLAGPGQCFKFDVDGLIRAPLSQEAPALQSLIQTGILSPNEARERMGLSPREGGDTFVEFNSGNPAPESDPENIQDVEEDDKPRAEVL